MSLAAVVKGLIINCLAVRCLLSCHSSVITVTPLYSVLYTVYVKDIRVKGHRVVLREEINGIRV